MNDHAAAPPFRWPGLLVLAVLILAAHGAITLALRPSPTAGLSPVGAAPVGAR